MWIEVHNNGARLSRYTYRCVVLPDDHNLPLGDAKARSQCTYRCVVLPDAKRSLSLSVFLWCLNAPTGAWCSLTGLRLRERSPQVQSQCTYRCVVLPD